MVNYVPDTADISKKKTIIIIKNTIKVNVKNSLYFKILTLF
jgi:hypothetical protein